MSLLKRHHIFIDNQCYTSLKGGRGGYGESIILKLKVFSEALGIAFLTAILQNFDYATVHILLLTNLLVGCLVLVTGLYKKNYRFVNENVSK